MKKVLSVILVFSLCFSFSSLAFAEQFVSIEEYEAAIQAEGEKYGVSCEVLDYDPQVNITTEMLENALDEIRTYAQSLKVECDSKAIVAESLSSQVKNAQPKLMPIDADVYTIFIVSSSYGSADMRAEANVTVDGQNDYVISVNSTNVRQSGAFVNFVSWDTIDITTTKNSPSTGWIEMDITGAITFSYADPFTGITTGVTNDVTKVVTIDCSDFY